MQQHHDKECLSRHTTEQMTCGSSGWPCVCCGPLADTKRLFMLQLSEGGWSKLWITPTNYQCPSPCVLQNCQAKAWTWNKLHPIFMRWAVVFICKELFQTALLAACYTICQPMSAWYIQTERLMAALVKRMCLAHTAHGREWNLQKYNTVHLCASAVQELQLAIWLHDSHPCHVHGHAVCCLCSCDYRCCIMIYVHIRIDTQPCLPILKGVLV